MIIETAPRDAPAIGAAAHAVLSALPEWFGRPEANAHYAALAACGPTLIARDPAGVGGFLTLVRHTEAAAEIAVIAVRRDARRQGVGRALVRAAEARLASDARFLTVKTVADAPGDDGPYRETRAFYDAMGFHPLEVFPTLWDARTPCLFLVKALG